MSISAWSSIVALASLAPAASVASAGARAETVAPVFRSAIPNIAGKSMVAVEVRYPPGGTSPAHRHDPSAFIFAYVLAGSVASSVDGGPTRVYRAGESWLERPGADHTVSRNASRTEPARLLAVFVLDTGAGPLTRPDVRRAAPGGGH